MSILSSQPRMYADGSHLTFSSNDVTAIEEALNRDLESVNNWLVSNKLILNSTKTEFMLIGGLILFRDNLILLSGMFLLINCTLQNP